MLSKLFKKMTQHKLVTGIGILVIITVSYIGFQNLAGDNNQVQYVTAVAENGTLVSSITGSGQVGVSNQVNIKPKVSGDVVWVGVKNGQEVWFGQAILSIDDTDASEAY